MSEPSLDSPREPRPAVFWRAWLAGWICGVSGMAVAFYAVGWLLRRASE
jgi:hypothetical protein